MKGVDARLLLLLFAGCRGGGQPELDLYFVGDGAVVGPHAFADAVVAALQHEAAFEHADIAFLTERGRRFRVAGAALDAHPARYLEAIGAPRLDRRGHKAR